MRKRLLMLMALSCLSSSVFAVTPPPKFGITYSQNLPWGDPTIPKNMHGYHIALAYHPPTFVYWNKLHIYFDASYGHWWVHETNHCVVDTYSIAPLFQYFLWYNKYASPFVTFSIGLTYLNHLYMGKRNLGMHFSFQDQFYGGVAFGEKQQFELSLGIIHYSNGRLCGHNSGFTLPLMMYAEYRFG